MTLPGTIEYRAHCKRCGVIMSASTNARTAKRMLREHYRSGRCDENIGQPCQYQNPERDWRYCDWHRSWVDPLDANCAKKNEAGRVLAGKEKNDAAVH